MVKQYRGYLILDNPLNIKDMRWNMDNNEKIIEMAISKCKELIDNYDDNINITDIDIRELIEILKGRDEYVEDDNG